MSTADRSWVPRFKELYDKGIPYNEIAEDPELRATVLNDIDNARSRAWEVSHIVRTLVRLGELEPRAALRDGTPNSRPLPKPTAQPAPRPAATVAPPKSTTQSGEYDRQVDLYLKLIDTQKQLNRIPEPLPRPEGRYEAVILSDLHCPDERKDLIAEVCARHAGKDCYIVGDLNDFERFSRFDCIDWRAPSLIEALRHTDALLEVMAQSFPRIFLMFGNHDLRLPRKAAKVLGPDYHFITQEWLIHYYEKRHGIHVIHNSLIKQNGRPVDGLFYWHKVGKDCILSHAETSGKPVGKGVEKAHDFFYSHRKELGIGEFGWLLQAHTHKQSYHRNRTTGVHCFEIGCMCDLPGYHLHKPQHSPVEHGYFYLVQDDGITNRDESRLICLD